MNCIYGNYPGVFLTWGRYLLLIYVVKYFDTSNSIENKVSYFMSCAIASGNCYISKCELIWVTKELKSSGKEKRTILCPPNE